MAVLLGIESDECDVVPDRLDLCGRSHQSVEAEWMLFHHLPVEQTSDST